MSTICNVQLFFRLRRRVTQTEHICVPVDGHENSTRNELPNLETRVELRYLETRVEMTVSSKLGWK